MSTHDSLLGQSVDRLFAAIAGDPADAGAWNRIEDMGIADLLLPEDKGGMGTGWPDAAITFHLSGYHALALPVSETMIARKLLHACGGDIPSGPIALTSCADGRFEAAGPARPGCFSGTVSASTAMLPGSRLLASFQQDDRDDLVLLDPAQACEVVAAENMARESIPTCRFDGAEAIVLTGQDAKSDTVLHYGALMRAAQIAGALAACLDKSVAYTHDRSQFGRPLRKFQAIQHQIAVLAEETAATYSAAAAAAIALDNGDGGFEIAAAKLRANQAAGIAAAIAHQIHGAIGITEEFGLYRHTQRLWSWRAEFGNDRHWAQVLGKRMLHLGETSAWSFITSRGRT